MTLLLRVAYDGTDFHGFARQEGTGRCKGRSRRRWQSSTRSPCGPGPPVAPTPGSTLWASWWASSRRSRSPTGVVLGLTSKLPRDIGVLGAWPCELPDGRAVDPRFFNDGKTYRYRIRCTPHRVPTTVRGEWHPGPAARRGGDAGGGAGVRRRTRLRRLPRQLVPGADDGADDARGRGGGGGGGGAGRAQHLAASDTPAIVTVTVRGEAFLQNMVRIMVGTLVEVGLGRRPPTQIAELLARPDRRRTGRTAPPQGLTLVEVHWPDPWPPADSADARAPAGRRAAAARGTGVASRA